MFPPEHYKLSVRFHILLLGLERPDLIDAKATNFNKAAKTYGVMKAMDMIQEASAEFPTGLMSIEQQLTYKYAILPEGSGG